MPCFQGSFSVEIYKQCSEGVLVCRQVAHFTVLVSMLINERTMLARPACTARGARYVHHVHISGATWLWRRSWKSKQMHLLNNLVA